MALQTWRLIGVSATIAIYIGGVIFLSMNNVPGPHPKRFHIERFGEVITRTKPKLIISPSFLILLQIACFNNLFFMYVSTGKTRQLEFAKFRCDHLILCTQFGNYKKKSNF